MANYFDLFCSRRTFKRNILDLIYLYKLIDIASKELKGGLIAKLGTFISFLGILVKLLINKSIIMVCLVDGSLIGGAICFKINSRNNRTYILECIVLEPNFRGLSYGSTLLSFIEKKLKAIYNNQKPKIVVNTIDSPNNKAISFYLAFGFTRTKKIGNSKFVKFEKDIC